MTDDTMVEQPVPFEKACDHIPRENMQEQQQRSIWTRLSQPLSSEMLIKYKEFIIKNYLPIIFAVALIWALAWPVPGRYVVGVTVLDNIHIIQEICMGIVFFISGLTLDTQELKNARSNLWSVAFGFVSILLLTPCLGFAMREIPLQPKEFAIGLVIFCVVPTTLGVGVALVRSCSGNEAIALLLTVATNLLAVFTMPLELKLLFMNYDLSMFGLTVSVDIPNLLAKLSITILAPSILGKVLREAWGPAKIFAKTYRTELSLFSTTNLAFIIWQTLSGARDTLFKAEAGMIVAVIALGASIHIFFLCFNFIVIWFMFKAKLPEASALIIISSQKSAPVAVTVISYMTTDVAQQGMLAIPCIVGQLTQIFIGSAIVPFIRKQSYGEATENLYGTLYLQYAGTILTKEPEKKQPIATAYIQCGTSPLNKSSLQILYCLDYIAPEIERRLMTPKA